MQKKAQMNSKSSSIIKAGFLVGTLDILSAFLFYFINSGKKDVTIVLKYVASGLFGKEAFSAGYWMIIAGLLLHYMIAFAFTLLFFWLFPKTQVFSRNKIMAGILYGIFIWVIMNLVVVPLSAIGNMPSDMVNATINMLIVIVCIGIPLSFMASNFYKKEDFSTLGNGKVC